MKYTEARMRATPNIPALMLRRAQILSSLGLQLHYYQQLNQIVKLGGTDRSTVLASAHLATIRRRFADAYDLLIPFRTSPENLAVESLVLTALIGMKRLNEAQALVEALLKSNPHSAANKMFLSDILWQKREYELSLRYAEEARTMVPKDVNAAGNAIRKYLRRFRFQDAIRAFRQAIQ